MAGRYIVSESPVRPRGGIVLGFSVVGLFIILLTARSTQILGIPASAQFGLLELLPYTYWVGLALMGLALALAVLSKSMPLLAITGTLFFGVFAGTPALVEPNPPFWDGYTHLNDAQSIILTGRIPTSPLRYVANWPGFFLGVASISLLAGIEPLELLALMPFITGGLTFLALFVFLRSLLGDSVAALGSILGALLNVWAQFHLSPQSFGLILALLLLATLWRKAVPFRVANVFLFVGLVVTHPTSTILVIGVVAAHALLLTLSRMRKASRTKELAGRFAFSPLMLYVTAWLSWLFFLAIGSSQVAETAILTRMGSILLIPEQSINIATARTVENIYFWGPTLRLASLSVYGLLGVLGLVFLSRSRDSSGLALFLWGALIGLIAFAAADLLAFDGLLYDRSFMLFAALMPGIALAGLAIWKIGSPLRRGIIAALVVASLAAASTVYYQQAFYHVSDRSRAVAEQLTLAEEGSWAIDGQFPIPVWLESENPTPWSPLVFRGIFPTTFADLSETITGYAVFDETAELWYRQWYGINIYRFYEASQPTHSIIYDSGGTLILFFSPSSPTEAGPAPPAPSPSEGTPG